MFWCVSGSSQNCWTQHAWQSFSGPMLVPVTLSPWLLSCSAQGPTGQARHGVPSGKTQREAQACTWPKVSTKKSQIAWSFEGNSRIIPVPLNPSSKPAWRGSVCPPLWLQVLALPYQLT